MIDLIILTFLCSGMTLGLWRGFSKTLILALSTYVPAVISVYFFDDISNFVDIIIASSGDKNTAALGALGAFSGLIAFVAISVAVFLMTRFFLTILSTGELSWPSRIYGGIIGLISQNLAVTLIYFLLYTATPADTLSVMRDASWTKINWPFHKAAYPVYRQVFADRTARFSESIASLGLANTLIGGVGDFTLSADLASRLNDPQIKSMIRKASKLAASLDVDALKAQLNELQAENLSAEHIDQLIKAEDANRRAFIDRQLNSTK